MRTPAGSPSYDPAQVIGPPPWVDLVGEGEGEPAPATHEGAFPWEGWPKAESIDYVNKLIIVLILLLALPWLIGKLLTHPEELSGHAGGLSMGAASMGA